MHKLIILFLTTLLCACSQGVYEAETKPTADLIINNAKIYTVDSSTPWAEALAVKNGKIVFVGTSNDALKWRTDGTEIVDLQQRFLMPGINDAHMHPMLGATKVLFECQFPFTANLSQVKTAVSACVDSSGDEQWVRGGQWGSSFFVEHNVESPRRWLDKISGDKAIILSDDAYHNFWLNSRALKELGIDENTVATPGVEFQLDAQGQLNGIIIEAFGFVKKTVHWSEQQYLAAAEKAIDIVNGYGITGIKGTAMAEADAEGFISLADREGLNAHMAVALFTSYGHRTTPIDIEQLNALRDKLENEAIDFSFAKIFMDGVPTVARTAAMLQAYLPVPGETKPNYGVQHLDQDVLTRDLIALDKAGYTVKIHTAGDRSVRTALNAIEAARSANGDSGLRHELAHAGYISAEDMARFKKLNAVADLSPYIWYPSPIMDSVVTALGERGKKYWPVRSLLDSGAPVAMGSDWPAAVPTPNPWPGIEALVTRASPSGTDKRTLWPEQAVTIVEAVRLFTLEGAKALKLEKTTGSITVGKSADFIELDRNIIEVDAHTVGETQVLSTWYAGKQVYQKEK